MPPGQYVVNDFPVLSAGPTPRTSTDEWTLTIDGAVDASRTWSWDQLRELPSETFTTDIHCVTKWTKLGTTWTGVSLDTLLAEVETEAEYLTAWCDGDYTTNLTIEDISDGKAWIAYDFDGDPLTPSTAARRGCAPRTCTCGRARSGSGVSFTPSDEPGFWEAAGHHNHGDPWREQRYRND